CHAVVADAADKFALSLKLRTFGLLLFVFCTSGICLAQSLVPRAYVVGPVDSNAITLQYLLNNGSILFDPALPITDASGKLNTGVFSYYHSLDFFGRSANFVASLPYTEGNFQGTVNGKRGEVHRSGLLDSAFRFSVNLKGGPAMHLQ